MIDLTTMLYNLSQSLIHVESLVIGFGYLLGIALMVSGLQKFTLLGKNSREKAHVPLAYIVGGAALVFLPSSLGALSNTLFGTSSALQYTEYVPYNTRNSVKIIIQTSGLIWFVRGTVLIVHAAEPGEQHGNKGLFFVFASICAMNFDYTVAWTGKIIQYFMNLIQGTPIN